MQTTVLVVDDDTEIRYSLERVLSTRDYRVILAASAEEGIEAIKRESPEVVLMDLRMGGMSGIEALQNLRKESQRSMIILMTAFGTTQTAIEAMKFGAYDYIIKPFDLNKILALVAKAKQAATDVRGAENSSYTPIINADDYKEGIVGNSEPMQDVFKIIGQVAPSDATVMVTGESGTGKELIARCICHHSQRSDASFLAVNCAAIPDNLIESELFGHEKGSFTGATNQRIGKFEIADGGTLFLDEIGDMSLATQAKILRVIQEGGIQRVGGSETIKVDVRLIAATNKDLEKMVEDNKYREDLYYRLNVVRIRLPALRERIEDVPDLVDFMLQKLHKVAKTKAERISTDVLDVLKSYPWPGNVRELENVVYRCAVIAKGETIVLSDLPDELRGGKTDSSRTKSPAKERDKVAETATVETTRAPVVFGTQNTDNKPLTVTDAFDFIYKQLRSDNKTQLLEVTEKEIIQRALGECEGNQVKTSALLGITRATLRKRIDQFNIKL